MTNSFSDHLERYGILPFDSDEYWSWGAAKLGAKRAQTLNRLRRPIEGGHPTSRQLLAFYDFIADPDVAAVVHSSKGCAIKVSGEEVAAHIKDRKQILDIGCSIGYTATWLAAIEPSRVVTGIDFSQAAVHTATEYANRLGITNVKFVHADVIERVPEGPYDAAYDCQTLYGLTNSRGHLDRALDNILARLGPDGILVSIPAAATAAGMHEYTQCLRNHGLGPIGLGFVTFADMGTQGAYPILIAHLGHPVVDLDIDGMYHTILTKLATMS
jgi:predicted O-methyltransferase YrrM